jgi:hypothetical protein
VAGFTLAESDTLRKAMGKKTPEVMKKARQEFVNGCVKHGMQRPTAETIFDKIEFFAGYAFNRSHSAAYALIAYRTAYLKANDPVEFMTALLTSERDNTDKIAQYIEEARRMEIPILPPDVNKSFARFTVESGGIRYGLLGVKNIGEKAIESIVQAREEKGPVASLTDPAKGQWGLFKPIQFWEFYKTIQQNGCSFFSADQTTVTVNDPKCVEALQMMVDLQTKYHVMPTDAEMGGVSDGDLFKSGKLGMLVSGIWMFAAFKDAPFKWDIAVEPGMTQKATHFFSNAVVVSKGTPSAQAAYEWAKFFTTSPEAATIRVKSGWELPALNNPDLFKSYLEQTPPANRQAVFDSLDYLVVPPVIERQSEMQDTVNQLLDKVKLGQLTPQQALDQAKTEIESLLK